MIVRLLSLSELQRIKRWHAMHRHDHPLEYQLWDALLTVWVGGWVGLLPALLFSSWWAPVMCVAAVLAPGAYVGWRALAHRHNRIRCEWLPAELMR